MTKIRRVTKRDIVVVVGRQVGRSLRFPSLIDEGGEAPEAIVTFLEGTAGRARQAGRQMSVPRAAPFSEVARLNDESLPQ